MSCLICERIEMIKQGVNPYFIIELETGYAVIGDYQHFRGYSLFLLKEHVTELHFMSKAMKVKHLEEMSIVYEAVFNVFKPDKMNAELLGNGHPHIHWHLHPRYDSDPLRRSPVWKLPSEMMFRDEVKPTSAELSGMVSDMKNEIIKLTT
jgi:diadenosine tetraphosphate (Ap4A) HIT family hydrolase